MFFVFVNIFSTDAVDQPIRFRLVPACLHGDRHRKRLLGGHRHQALLQEVHAPHAACNPCCLSLKKMKPKLEHL